MSNIKKYIVSSVCIALLCGISPIVSAQHGFSGGAHGFSGGAHFSGGGAHISSGSHGGSSGTGSGQDQSGVGAAILGILCLIAFIAIIVAFSTARTNVLGGHLRIKGTLPGEAPEEICRAWVGLVLPLTSGNLSPRLFSQKGVLTQSSEEPVNGYAVEGRVAIEILAKTNPVAADWWRTNAPHTLSAGYHFVFPAAYCTVEPLGK
jgi:hypothetical protein